MSNVTISSSALDPEYCWTSPQQYLVDITNLLAGTYGASGIGLNYGNAVPPTVNEDLPWFRTNSDGTPDALYAHASGLWLSKHPMAPGIVAMYEGTELGIKTFDGGEDAPVGPYSGWMWEKVSEMDARSPIGPGTLANSGTAIAVGDDLGVDEVVLDAGNTPQHSHNIVADSTGTVGAGDGGWVIGVGAEDVNNRAVNLPASATNPRTGITETFGAADPDPISVIGPVRGIWFIRRTSRLYYRI